MNTTIKQLALLNDITTADQRERLEFEAKQHRRFSSITFKVLKVADNVVTIQTEQGKHLSENYTDQKRLIALTKEMFTPTLDGYKIHVHATPHTAHPASEIDASWLSEKMLRHHVRVKDIVEDTGLDKTNVSAWVNGKRPMSQIAKALFQFYFKCKEQAAPKAKTA